MDSRERGFTDALKHMKNVTAADGDLRSGRREFLELVIEIFKEGPFSTERS
jgi:hypothetical protein